MPAKKGKPSNDGQESGVLRELQELRGGGHGIDVTSVDSTLLWLAVVGLAKCGASIQIGLTRDKSSWAIQMWDGSFPVKDYYTSTEAFNRHLAAVARLTWKRELPAEAEDLIREYNY